MGKKNGKKIKIKEKKRKTVKAQLQIQEMAFVLVAIILFFGLLLIVFSMFQSAKIKELAYSIRKEKVISSLESIANMPEFSCREAFCIDEEKILGYLNLSDDDKKNYENLWEKSKIALIKIKKIYPPYSEDTEEDTETLCNEVNDFSRCNTIIIYKKNTNYQAYSTFMPICHYNSSIGKQCEIAKIIVGFETPE